MRNYIVATWSDSDQYNYSGEQIGQRGRNSGRVHFNPDGSACVASYGDDEPATKRKTSIPLSDRILPQAKRVRVLTEQLIELESEHKAGMDVNQYSLLRDVLIAKRDRAQVLYLKASSVKPVRNDDETDEFNGENDYESCETDYTYATLQGTDKSSFVGQLSRTNIFRKPVEKAIHGYRILVRWSQQAKAYYRTLKDL